MFTLIKEMIDLGTKKRPSKYLAHLKKNTTKAQHKQIAKAMAADYVQLKAKR